MNWKLELALFSCAVLGLRHGFDYDHLAAISDITAVQKSWKQGMRLGITYAMGHALTVVALGSLVVMLHIPLPARLDNWTERLIGATLIVLGIGVVANLIRHSHSHQAVRSRWAILITGCQYAWWRTVKLFQTTDAAARAFRVELQRRIGFCDWRSARTGRGDAEPADAVSAGGQPGRNSAGDSWDCWLSRLAWWR